MVGAQGVLSAKWLAWERRRRKNVRMHAMFQTDIGRKITRFSHPLPALELAHGLARPLPPGRTFPGGVVAGRRLTFQKPGHKV